MPSDIALGTGRSITSSKVNAPVINQKIRQPTMKRVALFVTAIFLSVNMNNVFNFDLPEQVKLSAEGKVELQVN